MAKVNKKKQGVKAEASALAASNNVAESVLNNRGLGSAYAQAVETVKQQAQEMMDQKASFLGTPKRTLDPNENTHSSILPKGFKP